MDTTELPEAQRSEQAAQIAAVGEFRPGNLSSTERKCGNPQCRCAGPGGARHRGWQVTRKVRQKTRCRSVPAHALDETRRQMDEYRRFQDLVERFTEINELHQLTPDYPDR